MVLFSCLSLLRTLRRDNIKNTTGVNTSFPCHRTSLVAGNVLEPGNKGHQAVEQNEVVQVGKGALASPHEVLAQFAETVQFCSNLLLHRQIL